MKLITSSFLKSYRACPRLCRHQYVDLARPVSRADALDFGTLEHAGLEAWWTLAKLAPGEPDTWLDAAVDAIRAAEREPYRLARAEALMVAYHARWSSMEWAGEGLKVLAVEAEFVAPLINPATGAASKTWQRGGKIDAVVQGLTSKRVYLVEHKTSSEDFGDGSEYWRRLTLDPQISHYHVGARALGYDVSGCIYDVMRRPGQRPLMATPVASRKWTKGTAKEPSRLHAGQREIDETPDEHYDRVLADIVESPSSYFSRKMVVRLAEEERRSAENDWQTALLIRASERLSLWPQNPGSCGMYGRTCVYLGVCSGVESLDDPTRFRRASQTHEELSSQSDHAKTPDASGAEPKQHEPKEGH